MTFGEWVHESRTRVQENGLTGVRQSVIELGIGAARRFDRLVPFGQPIYTRDWEVLVILDACRADLMAEVADEYQFVDTQTVTSVAGGSRSWMLRNFSEEYREETQETVYVTGNPFSEEVLHDSYFQNMEEVWKYAWDESLNTVPARALTEIAIHEWRNRQVERMIVHYMQPHHPFVPEPMDSGMNKENLKNPERPVWQKLKTGDLAYDDVWDAYKENLRYVLDDVRLLLDNLESENVIISADHGNALGEWGFFGHGDVPIPAIRRVPWCRTMGRDTGSYQPDLEPTADDYDVEEKLRELGYM